MLLVTYVYHFDRKKKILKLGNSEKLFNHFQKQPLEVCQKESHSETTLWNLSTSHSKDLFLESGLAPS